MPLRDFLASQVMVGLVVARSPLYLCDMSARLPEECYRVADEMLEWKKRNAAQ